MSMKSVVTERLERARSFADNVRAVYEKAYNSATEMRKHGVKELIDDIQPKLRSAVEGGLSEARTRWDEVNRSLADRAIPLARRSKVSEEQLENKTKVAQQATKKAGAPKVKASASRGNRVKASTAKNKGA